MSARIVLRSGKVLVYNSGGAISVEEGCVTVRTDGKAFLVARVPVELVERAEFDPPCRVYKERPLRRLNW